MWPAFAVCTAVTLRGISMKDDIERVEYASMMYDFYGGLLSESQSEVMALYHEDNLSLSEIAEQLGMTRQAVHYTLKKAERSLDKFEEKLGLIATYEKNQKLASEALHLIAASPIEKDHADRLKHLIRQLSE